MHSEFKGIILALAAVFLLLFLWQRFAYFGPLFVVAMLALGSFLACRASAWLTVFVIPLSSAVLLAGLEDGSFAMLTAQLHSHPGAWLVFSAGLVIITVSAISGALVGYRRRTGKSKGSDGA